MPAQATTVPPPHALSPETQAALQALLQARQGGGDNRELAADLSRQVWHDVDKEWLTEGEAVALLQVYGAPVADPDEARAEARAKKDEAEAKKEAKAHEQERQEADKAREHAEREAEKVQTQAEAHAREQQAQQAEAQKRAEAEAAAAAKKKT